MTTTVGDLIRRARLHHPRFAEERHPNLVAVEYLSTRQADLLHELADALMDRLSKARKVADTISNSLVGVDANGVSYAVQTDADGYDVIADASGFLYTGPTLIATDPYGTAKAGFPLPAEALKLVDIYAELTDSQRWLPVTIVPQRDITRRTGSSDRLQAIVNGFRLVPVRNPPENTGASFWDQVKKVTMVWVDKPVRFTLTGAAWDDQTFVLPDPYVDPLEWELAAHFANREQGLDADFPRDYAATLLSEAERRREAAARLAKRDHSPLRFTQAARNR